MKKIIYQSLNKINKIIFILSYKNKILKLKLKWKNMERNDKNEWVNLDSAELLK